MRERVTEGEKSDKHKADTYTEEETDEWIWKKGDGRAKDEEHDADIQMETLQVQVNKNIRA